MKRFPPDSKIKALNLRVSNWAPGWVMFSWARQPEYRVRVRVRVRKIFLDIYSGTQVRVSHSVRYSGYSVRSAQTQELRSGSGA